MDKDDIQLLFAYNEWANRRVLAAAGQLSLEQFVAPAGLSHGGIRGALAHVLGAEIVWRLRCQEGISLPAMPAESEFPTVAALQARFEQEAAAMRGYLAVLDDATLSRPFQYKNTQGMPFENVLWQVLAHVVNHGTQFRSEAAVALSSLGYSPGNLDLIAFIRR